MTATRFAERQIVRQILHGDKPCRPREAVEHLIPALALAAAGAVLLALFPELLWAGIAAAVLVALGLG